MTYLITEKDRQVLRELAKKQLFMANQESNLKKKEEWYLHGSLTVQYNQKYSQAL